MSDDSDFRPTRRAVLRTAGAAVVGGAGVAYFGHTSSRAQPGESAGRDALLVPEALFRPTGSGCTVHWVPKEPVWARILSGPEPSRLAVVGERRPEEETHLAIANVAADSDYFVQCQFRRPRGSDWISQPARRLHTARPAGSTFRVALVADSHVYVAAASAGRMNNIRKTIERVLADQPDFVVFLGDEGGVNSLKDPPGFMNAVHAHERWQWWRTAFGPLLAAVPTFLVLGNHEGEGGFHRAVAHPGTTAYFQRWGTIARKRFLLNPDGDTYAEGGENSGWMGDQSEFATGGAANGNRSPFQNYFAWSWGDALFVVLDVYRYTNVGGTTPASVDDWTLGAGQFRWLERVLGDSARKWKFVICHHVIGGWEYDMSGTVRNSPYLYGRGGARYARVGEQARVTELMQRTGARFFLYGHDHIFAHQQEEGIHFVCCGRPSYLGQIWENPGWKEAYGDAGARNPNDFYGAIGYTSLTISPQRVGLRYIKTGTDPDRPDNVDGGEGDVVYEHSVTA